MPDEPIDTRILEFRDWRDFPATGDPFRHDISTVAAAGTALFVTCDEAGSLERLTLGEGGVYSSHFHFPLGAVFDLPDPDDPEMDIEGLDVDDGWLWIVGSHALKRDKPKRGTHGAAEGLARMVEIDRDANRYFIGCVPLVPGAEGPRPVASDGAREAASIKLKKNKSTLLKWLEDDPHLAPFLSIPSKENGFDIEGIAVKRDRVWLGLRGPVLRGHAVILELQFKRSKPRRLKARKIEAGRRYRKHLIPARGLGIRDLCVDGPDLLLLTGTPLASDGPSEVLRWRGAAYDTVSGVVDQGRIERLLDLPYRGPVDHPEGIAILPPEQTEGSSETDAGGRRLIVVHDAPDPKRVSSDPARLIADLHPLPDPAG